MLHNPSSSLLLYICSSETTSHRKENVANGVRPRSWYARNDQSSSQLLMGKVNLFQVLVWSLTEFSRMLSTFWRLTSAPWRAPVTLKLKPGGDSLPLWPNYRPWLQEKVWRWPEFLDTGKSVSSLENLSEIASFVLSEIPRGMKATFSHKSACLQTLWGQN